MKNQQTIWGQAKGIASAFFASIDRNTVQTFMLLDSKNEQMVRNFDRTFGDAKGIVQDFVDEFGWGFGKSEDAVRGLLAQQGMLLVGMGLTKDAAAEYTVKLGEAAVALGNVYQGEKSVEQIQRMLTQALGGSFEALDSLGIYLDSAAIKAGLAEKGLDGLEGAARNQAEAAEIVEQVWRQASGAIDDLDESTNNAWESQQKLTTAIGDIRDAFGQIAGVLAPGFEALATLTTYLAEIVDFLTRIPGLVELAGVALGGLMLKGAVGSGLARLGVSGGTAAAVGRAAVPIYLAHQFNERVLKGPINRGFDWAEEQALRRRQANSGAGKAFGMSQSERDRAAELAAARGDAEAFAARYESWKLRGSPTAAGILGSRYGFNASTSPGGLSALQQMQFGQGGRVGNINLAPGIASAVGPAKDLRDVLYRGMLNAQGISSALQGATDPIFAAVSAMQELNRLNEEITSASSAGGALITDEEMVEFAQRNVDFMAAMETLAATTGPQAAIEAMAVAMGTTATEAERVLTSLGLMKNGQWVVPLKVEFGAVDDSWADFKKRYRIPGKAAGGSIAAGELSWVGERGPELFMPNRSGTIIPNNRVSSLMRRSGPARPYQAFEDGSHAGYGGTSDLTGGYLAQRNPTVVVNVAGTVISERNLVDAVRQGLRKDRIRGGSLEL